MSLVNIKLEGRFPKNIGYHIANALAEKAIALEGDAKVLNENYPSVAGDVRAMACTLRGMGIDVHNQVLAQIEE